MSIGTMPSGSVVVHLNILKDSLAHDFTGVEAFAVDQFHFQGMEETLGHRIVMVASRIFRFYIWRQSPSCSSREGFAD
jgi:hypothetical protein